MPPTTAPKVSILMPVFNAEPYVVEAVESILDQTFSDFELIAIDDGSTDRSFELLQSFSDPRMRIARNPTNVGIIKTLNDGLRLCRGRYFARMDADDISLPTRLERQIAHLEKHPQCILIGTNRESIDELGRPINAFNRPATDGRIVRWKLLTGNFMMHSSVMARREELPEDLYDLRYKHAEDYAAWLLLSSMGSVENLPEKLLKVRFHGQSIGFRNKMPQVRAAMSALSDHLYRLHGVRFSFEALALWSAPQDAEKFPKPDDFLALLRWMNPLRKALRGDLHGRLLLEVYAHYMRRLILLSICHKKRLELLIPVITAALTSLMPRR